MKAEQNENDQIVENLVEIELVLTDNFLKVKETLTRIGVASKHKNALFQSCHILHKRGKFYIVHFKELFKLDNKPTNIDDTDIRRRNTIVRLLSDWKLINVVRPEQIVDQLPMNQVKIISFANKGDWELIPKYTIGKFKAPEDEDHWNSF
jgi:hypothetical protein